MNADDSTTPRAFVRPRKTGANGLPDIGSDQDDNVFEAFGDVALGSGYPSGEGSRQYTASRSNYVPWIAAGAVVVGAVGAVIGCMRQSSRPRNPAAWRSPMIGVDPHGVTPPHGDKLLPRE